MQLDVVVQEDHEVAVHGLRQDPPQKLVAPPGHTQVLRRVVNLDPGIRETGQPCLRAITRGVVHDLNLEGQGRVRKETLQTTLGMREGIEGQNREMDLHQDTSVLRPGWGWG